MPEYKIRDARGGDRDAIGHLWRELMDHHRSLDARFAIAADGERMYVRHVLEMVRSSDARVRIAESLEPVRAIGYIMGELQARPPIALPGLYGFVSDLYVVEPWRSRGVGRALYQELRRWFVTRKAMAVELYTAELNPEAQAFWAEMGLAPFLTLMHGEL